MVIAIKKISISFRLETWWTRKWDVKQMNSWSRWGLKSIKKDNTFRCNMQLVARSESTGSPDLDQRLQLAPYKAWLNFDWLYCSISASCSRSSSMHCWSATYVFMRQNTLSTAADDGVKWSNRMVLLLQAGRLSWFLHQRMTSMVRRTSATATLYRDSSSLSSWMRISSSKKGNFLRPSTLPIPGLVS